MLIPVCDNDEDVVDKDMRPIETGEFEDVEISDASV
jgi:hypothetical protein